MILKVEAGPRKGETVALRPGEAMEVGRRGRHFAVPEDQAMSAAHFIIECNGAGRVTLCDLNSSNGTTINGEATRFAFLHAGDKIAAGETLFVLAGPPGPAPEPVSVLKELEGDPLEILRRGSDPLFALLDAARAPEIPTLLRASETEHECLYEGEAAVNLADSAPYLAAIPRDSLLLEDLIESGWGDSWGIYLHAPASLAEVRKHFRQFLLVNVGGRKLYFRFYDPRVLRLYLPTCSGRELRDFFGPVRQCFMEAAVSGRVLHAAGPAPAHSRGTGMPRLSGESITADRR